MNNSDRLYFDYAATTPVDSRVIEAMSSAMMHAWGNMGSPHFMGDQAHSVIDPALDDIANFFNIDRNELMITSGATESINQAIKGVVLAGKKKHIITSTIEHKATLLTVQALMKLGFHATFIAPNEKGEINVEMVKSAITDDTAIISLIYVNNETGDRLDMESIAKVAREHKIPLHVDATQAVPHFKIDASKFDLMSMSAHKCYGPKGVGILYKRHFPRLNIMPLMDGSGGQLGIRSGTLANEMVVGLATALNLCADEFTEKEKNHCEFLEYLLAELSELGVTRNCHSVDAIRSTINLHIPHVHADSLMALLPNVAIAKGSACSSDSALPSHVLTEYGYSDEHALQSIRISFGRFTTKKAIKLLASQLKSTITHLQAIALGKVTELTMIHADLLREEYYHELFHPQLINETTGSTKIVGVSQSHLQLTLEFLINDGTFKAVSAKVMGHPYFIYVAKKIVQKVTKERLTEFKNLSLEELMGNVPTQFLHDLLMIERAIKESIAP